MTGQELKVIRQRLGYTQATLATSLGVGRNSIARYEMRANRGRYPVPPWLALIVRMWEEQHNHGGKS